MGFKGNVSRRRFLSVAGGAAAYGLRPAQGNALAAAALGIPPTPAISSPARDWEDAGVINLSNSPYAKLKTVPVRAVTIQEGFWSKRRATNVQSSIPTMHDELIEHGRMNNFLRLEGKSNAAQYGPVFSDSDIYKWLEAVAFVLQSESNPGLQGTASTMIHQVAAAQEASGYLNTYFTGDRASLRMLPATQETGHELYCIGHLLQGSIAWYRATGDPFLLEVAKRFVDGFLLPNYGPGPGKKPIVAGHPEIEMALIELYRTTGNRQYLDLAGYILHGDSRIPLTRRQIVYMFCGVPFTSRTKLEGHAVRAMYACCGATDYYLETGDPAYWKTLNLLWDDLVAHQIYITGGVGARESGESFGDAYELPNARAYGESCAAIGNMMWNWRMLAASGEARFTDVIERALYNGINSGMSLDGTTYCYRNPLAFNPFGDSSDRHSPEGKIRNPWYDTTCCPPNLERTFASLPGYFYSTSHDGVYVHLYDNSELNWHLQDGTGIHLLQKTNYPWDGEIHLTVKPARPAEFVLYVRIPGWSSTNVVKVNGNAMHGATPGEYLAIKRVWTPADTVELSFDMTTRLLKANPAVADDTGRVVLQRGPIVFCMEGLDQRASLGRTKMAQYDVQVGGSTQTRYEDKLLDGIVVLEHPGYLAKRTENRGLYYSAEAAAPAEEQVPLTLIPYYTWANREATEMQVWIPYRTT